MTGKVTAPTRKTFKTQCDHSSALAAPFETRTVGCGSSDDALGCRISSTVIICVASRVTCLQARPRMERKHQDLDLRTAELSLRVVDGPGWLRSRSPFKRAEVVAIFNRVDEKQAHHAVSVRTAAFGTR